MVLAISENWTSLAVLNYSSFLTSTVFRHVGNLCFLKALLYTWALGWVEMEIDHAYFSQPMRI